MTQRWKLIAFVAFLLVDVLLVAYVFRQQSSEQSSGTATPATNDTDLAAPTSPPTGEMRAIAKGGNAVVRWRIGSCDGKGRPLLEISVDGGKTFDERAVPVLDDADAADSASRAQPVRTLLAVDVESADKLRVVAGDAECKPVLYTTENGGNSWNRQVSLDAWYVDAARETAVSPNGSSKTGCEISSLSSFSDTEATMMCSGGLTLSTIDGGAVWTQTGTLNREVLAAMFVSRRTGFAIAKDSECARTFATEDGGASWLPAGCVDDIEVAALAGTASWLVAMDATTVRVSTDQGETWIDP